MLLKTVSPYMLSADIRKPESYSLHKIFKNTSFDRPVFSYIRTEYTIVSLYRRIRVSENPYCCIFFALIKPKKTWNHVFAFHIKIHPVTATHNKKVMTPQQQERLSIIH